VLHVEQSSDNGKRMTPVYRYRGLTVLRISNINNEDRE
jgi:hypothetical protein